VEITKKYGMKTTIDIDKELLEAAKQALGTDTLKGTIEASLRSVIRRLQLEELAESLGKVPLDLTPERLRSQRRKRARHVSR
jgi:Arc/MetJ family transcription regulator